jgi:hypothetical protein
MIKNNWGMYVFYHHQPFTFIFLIYIVARFCERVGTKKLEDRSD